MRHLSLLLTLSWATSLSFGQRAAVAGAVTDEGGQTVPGAYVTLATPHDTLRTATDANGDFAFSRVDTGEVFLFAHRHGGGRAERRLRLTAGQQTRVTLRLQPTALALAQATVSAKSAAQRLLDGTAAVAILDVRALRVRSNNTAALLKQIPGVHVRQAGGFGSAADTSVNGISGKQVKVFLDGIPLSYYGAGLGLNALPANLMDRIEVHRGVVPVSLGADALGGAINVVSRRDYGRYLDASYSVGSFNTHKANLNGQVADPERGLVLGANAFYNHADNDFRVDVSVPNASGNPVPLSARRFHDQFSNHLARVYGGLVERGFADRLIVSLRHSGLRDDLQHNAIMAQPYGEARFRENGQGATLEYAKADLFDALDTRLFVGVNWADGRFVDTSSNVYTWDGAVARRRTDGGGELSTSGNLLTLDTESAVARLNLGYVPWAAGRLEFNVFASHFARSGEDPVAAEFYGGDFFATPTVLSKLAAGLAYEHTVTERLLSSTSVKHFAYAAEGYRILGLELEPVSQAVSATGVAQGLRYVFSERVLAKGSYEYATRLPDEIELFGDFLIARPNPALRPERSHNANLGLTYRAPRLTVEVNAFHRATRDAIWLRTSRFFAQYQNLLRAAINGVDAQVGYRPTAHWTLRANASYQDLRNRSSREAAGTVDDRYFGARLPNVPYLFGASELRYDREGVLGGRADVSAWWALNYVHEFFLFWAIDGDRGAKNVVPEQWVHGLGLTLQSADGRYAVTLETTNLLDADVFDDFSVQRPGRALAATLRYFLKS